MEIVIPWKSGKKIDRAGLLDRAGDLAVELCGNSGDAAWKNLSGFSRELAKKIRIGADHLIGRNVMPATRHHAVRLTEIDTASYCFWLGHEKLAEFAVKSAALEEVIEFHFLQTARSAQALFIARSDVTGRRLALSLGFGAFKNNDLAWHGGKFGMGRLP